MLNKKYTRNSNTKHSLLTTDSKLPFCFTVISIYPFNLHFMRNAMTGVHPVSYHAGINVKETCSLNGLAVNVVILITRGAVPYFTIGTRS